MKVPEIILLSRIAVLREQPNQDIKTKNEEFSLYYKNFIYPLYPWCDVVIDCKYGRNLSNCWRISDYPEAISEFPLAVKVYDADGELLSKKEITIELVDSNSIESFKILCIGDSMTHHSIYVTHMQNRLYNVSTCGTRSFDGHVFFEGRGGWRYRHYFEKHSLKENERGATAWVSPFLFPKGIEGKEYFGDMEFYEASCEPNRSTCCFNGFRFQEIKDGQYYCKDGKLYMYPEEHPVSKSIDWEFSLKKYFERHNIHGVNAVSVLLGGNDLFSESYEAVEPIVSEYISNAKRFVEEVKKADKNIDVIINLPTCPADQNGWAHVSGCTSTAKMYAYSIRKGAKALIDEFEGVEGVHICPMLCVFDAENNYDQTTMRANLYNDAPVLRHNDNVHPNADGYRQMGDALAAVVEKLRNKKN